MKRRVLPADHPDIASSINNLADVHQSQGRLAEAEKGSEYASNEYEKWKTAYQQAKKDLDATLARHEEERKGLAEEREVIKEIMRYLGVLHDVKATEKSIAAGGRDSTIDPETGVSEVKAVSTAKLQVLYS